MASVVNAPIETRVEILDASLNLITWVKSLYPINSGGSLLQYSKELSDFGQCKFRISSYDTLFEEFGDILQPHQNHIRINRGGVIVWQGAIVENTKRTKDFIEVIAAEYLWYLNRILVNRTSLDPTGTGQQETATGFTMTGTAATVNFTSSGTGTIADGGAVSLSGFAPTSINGTWPITSFTPTTVTVTIPGGPISASTLGTITFSDNIYRIFNTANGATTMAAAVTAIINETITTFKGESGVHPLANMTLGEIDNPNYPPNSTDGTTTDNLTGPWKFGDGITAPAMTFDFQSILYVLKSFANVTYADFKIDGNLVFSFLSFLGKDNHYDVNFTWGEHGNAVDFNIPRLGQQMANDLIGIATDNNGNVLHAEQTDQTSITTSGLIQSVAAYADIKDQATLNARVQAEIPLISSPEDSPQTFQLDERAYPLGLYDVGDIITVNVDHDFLKYSAVKRIVGISTDLGDAGRELTTVQLNTPLPSQYGSTVSV